MKKLIAVLSVALLSASLFAQEAVYSSDADFGFNRGETAVWPAWFAIGELPVTPDLVGLRVTVPFSTRQESVTGVDVGLWGQSQYFEGLQVNILRNKVRDFCSGFQCGIYNSVGRGDLVGIQFGLWNEAVAFCGLQAGFINVSGASQGIQIGIVNRAETLYGFQFGIINIIRDAEVRFCPVINIGF